MERRADTHTDTDPRARFGTYLRTQRDKSELSLDDIARITKIPRSSLERLESGRFEELPGDVFVRGFLRSYARCVGLDGEEAVRKYAGCGLRPAPVSSELAAAVRIEAESILVEDEGGELLAPAERADRSEPSVGQFGPRVAPRVLRDAFDRARDRAKRRAVGTIPAPTPGLESGPIASESVPVFGTEERPVHRARTFLPPVLGDEEASSRRGPLTLAVIILVIVATLTMSYLLRRPGSSADGFTAVDRAAALTLPS